MYSYRGHLYMCSYRAAFVYVWLYGGICICVAIGRHLYMCGYRAAFVFVYREAFVYVWL